MHARLTAALRILSHICDRPDPLEPVSVGTLALLVGTSKSSASRICAELGTFDLLARGDPYGSYLIGARALELSGQAARPFASAADFALTTAYQATGETVALVAPSRGGAIVIGVVEAAWTLRVPTGVGESISHPGSAACRALDPTAAAPPNILVSTIGTTTEIATPILSSSRDCVAALVVRVPSHRSENATVKVRRAIIIARDQLEALIAARTTQAVSPGTPAMDRAGLDRSVIGASAAILNVLTDSDAHSIGSIAEATCIRPDRIRRVVEILRLTGFVSQIHDPGSVRLSWAIHGWHRAIVDSTLRGPATSAVASASERAGSTAYLVVRRGMHSTTMAEAIVAGDLAMASWLGRPGQLVASDGGPVLMMDFDDAQIERVFPHRISLTGRGTPKDLQAFLHQVHRARAGQLLVLADFGENGLTSIAAPVRDAGGSVVAAACIVGQAEHVAPRLLQLKHLATEFADEVTLLLRNPRPAQTGPLGQALAHHNPPVRPTRS